MATRKRICMILEGCYPYVQGGVSSWMHNYILGMPQYDFVLWVIGAEESQRGAFKYKLPDNVVEIREVFLDSSRKMPNFKKDIIDFTPEQMEEHLKLISTTGAETDPDFEVLFNIYNPRNNAQSVNVHSILMSIEFLQLATEHCRRNYPYVPYTDFFHTMRSMYLPMFYLMNQDIPEADVYHSTSTGYGGLLGAMCGCVTGKPFIVTEHGIYTREREEEIIRADWVSPMFKPMWNDMFYMLSRTAYKYATSITCLFERAKHIQNDIGAPIEKIKVISNGINIGTFTGIKAEKQINKDTVDIAAVVRFHPIKDIKTMIQAFLELKGRFKNCRLHVLGAIDDMQYFYECVELVHAFGLRLALGENMKTALKKEDSEKYASAEPDAVLNTVGDSDDYDIIFTGNVPVVKYYEGIDFTILTSISEGQPLAILESLGASRPSVTTNVGCCEEIFVGEEKDMPACGMVAPPMDVQSLAMAMLSLCQNDKLRMEMGEIGRQRVIEKYDHRDMLINYINNYREVCPNWPV